MKKVYCLEDEIDYKEINKYIIHLEKLELLVYKYHQGYYEGSGFAFILLKGSKHIRKYDLSYGSLYGVSYEPVMIPIDNALNDLDEFGRELNELDFDYKYIKPCYEAIQLWFKKTQNQENKKNAAGWEWMIP